MSSFSDDEELKEPAALRRERLIEEGRVRVMRQCHDRVDALFAELQKAFNVGLDTMADICQPGVTTGEIGTEIRPVKVSDETRILAINAVIRLLITARTEFALGRRYNSNVTLPSAEAVAMSAVVEAAFGLDTEKLLEGDLFETRP